MARIARVVAPGFPHHVTQRGNRRQQIFFNDDDYQAYLELMSEWCMKFGVETWAYCLMPNHIHLIVVPETEDGLKSAIGEAHRRYTRRIVVPLLKMVNKPWGSFLARDVQEKEIELFRKHERTGRPLGENSFLGKMESLLGRKIKPGKPGPKKKTKE